MCNKDSQILRSTQEIFLLCVTKVSWGRKGGIWQFVEITCGKIRERVNEGSGI